MNVSGTRAKAPVTIYEGPDGAGKTTLLRSARREGEAVHTHGPYPGEEQVWLHYLRSLLTPSRVAMDRSWLSEPIYGAAMRDGENRITVWQRRMLERLALSRSAVVVLCLPRLDVCRQTYLARKGEEYLDQVQQLEKVHRGYVEVSKDNTVLRTVIYNYEVDEPESFLEFVESSRPPRNDGPGVGSWRPGHTTLLVGDRPNYPERYGDLPFVADTGCSPWLAERLEESGVPEDELYWVNATDAEGNPTNPDFLEDLRPYRVVALGNRARAWLCRRAGVSEARFHTVEHPQFWKRFHHREPYPLLEVLTNGH
jgi:thymidylate kinase